MVHALFFPSLVQYLALIICIHTFLFDVICNTILSIYLYFFLNIQKTICGECKMPMTFHVMNFVSSLGIIRLICRRTLDPNTLSSDDHVIWTWERSRPDLNGHLVKETCQRTHVSSTQRKTRFKIVIQALLSQCFDKLKFFG